MSSSPSRGAAGRTFDLAVVGAAELAGETLVRVLGERGFPLGELYALESAGSLGQGVELEGREITVRELESFDFSRTHIALFCAGAKVSREFAPKAAAAGCLAIDDASEFSGQPDVPLVVPEVNPQALSQRPDRGIIANPCSAAIQLAVALKPIHDAAQIERIQVATYQSVSGAGRGAVEELARQTIDLVCGRGPVAARVMPTQIAFNCVPQIGAFDAHGWTREERLLVRETRSILGDDSIRMNATAVLVPVFHGDSQAVSVETRRRIRPDEARSLLANAPGVTVLDERRAGGFPTAATGAANRDTVCVGRIREDMSCERGLNLWIVVDNLLMSATNSARIAEILVRDHL